jgi:hypothetical protein
MYGNGAAHHFKGSKFNLMAAAAIFVSTNFFSHALMVCRRLFLRVCTSTLTLFDQI